MLNRAPDTAAIRALVARARAGDAQAPVALAAANDALLAAAPDDRWAVAGLVYALSQDFYADPALVDRLMRAHLETSLDDDAELWLELRSSVCTAYMTQGRWLDALAMLWSLLQHAEFYPTFVDRPMVLSAIGFILTQVGRADEALRFIEQAVPLAVSPRRLGDTYMDWIDALCMEGRLDDARVAFGELIARLPAEIGERARSKVALTELRLRAAEGDADEVLRLNALDVYGPLLEDEHAQRLDAVASALLVLGRPREARDAAREGVERLAAVPFSALYASLLRHQVQASTHLGDAHDAAAAFARYDERAWQRGGASFGESVMAVLGQLERERDSLRTRELETLNGQYQRTLEALEREIAARKEAEDRQRSRAMLEAAGQLAAGLAHDLNNLLTLGFAALDQLNRRVHDPAALGLLGDLEQTNQRAASLAGRLLSLTRSSTRRAEAIPVSRLFDDLRPLLRHALHDGVTLDVSAERDLAFRADRQEMEQVLLNLMFNARDAVGSNGHVSLHARADEGNVVIEVRDDGRGIEPADLERIFEPFFSTRPGRGHGLGLTIVQDVVEQAGGTIRCTSEPGVGTTFTLMLPRVALPADTVPPVADTAAPHDHAEQARSVLVIEDEPMLRALVVELLAMSGYAVTEAEDGQAGLEAFDAHAPSFDLIVSDVVMPRKSGVEVAQAVLERATAPILLMTGYADDDRLPALLASPRVDLLAKPFRPDQLLQRVSTLLEAAR